MHKLLLRRLALLVSTMPLCLLWCPAANSQTVATQTPRMSAPIDLTGYWVSIVTEDWRIRMVTPPKGDYSGVPLNPEGKRVTNTWDPKQVEATANVCKAYGAPDLLRVPERLHIYWENDDTLRLDTDAGKQTRLLHFDESKPKDDAPTLQGFSVASWQGMLGRMSNFERTSTQAQHASPEGYLKVVTTDLLPGYLRRDGVPYSENTTLEEYLDRITEANNDVYLMVQSIVTDPKYLTRPFVVSTPFKKLADSSGWNPEPCKALPF